MLKRILRFGRGPEPKHQAPPDARIYAIGDIHGRLDLLREILDLIDQDDAARGAANTSLIFLGDVVDRGPDSRGVIEKLIELSRGKRTAIFIKGNHDEIFVRTCQGDKRAAGLFDRVGGRETLLSYGVSEKDYDESDLAGLTKLALGNVPADHLAFLESFQDYHVVGDYLFVHAGVKPGVPIEEQKGSDLRWVRGEFLCHRGSHGRMVVHGHNITDEVDEQGNRIGLDTGGFATGRLTAMGVERSDRWFLST